ncbi:heme peroxidase family protein [Fulvivirga maritima]|uniref:peroxidase family protein n=1 Tax=Fulvivirga maritima TaxID=2904247 RepID=UPI001F1E5E7E|nr:heme peroxidase family protein [Fulvivirga maritima]UII26095.1 heme peroxidase family protein [Fulvivirga maritima]
MAQILGEKHIHGMAKAQGCSHLQLGTFCKMFPKLSTWAADYGISGDKEAARIAALLGGANGVMHDVRLESANSDIPAAYTFFAQFIDHDVTLDTTTALHGGEQKAEKLMMVSCPAHKGHHHHEALPNLRSASLDLDCIYGFGPEASPYLYDDSQHGRLLTGNEFNENDLARTKTGTALIGDPRNDENIFVAQMQLLFIRFHNRRLVGRDFKEAKQDVIYHYQYLVLNDFLKRVCDEKIYDYVLNEIKNNEYPKYDIVDPFGRICMPVEFSVAAYRFGHTLVRSLYPINSEYTAIELFDERFNTSGFSHVPKELTIDWRFILDVDPCQDYARCKAIDHLLTDELIRMPDEIVGKFSSQNDHSLAFRNLLRGYVMLLPSGQSVAKALSEKYSMIDPNQDLKLEKVFADNDISKKIADKLCDHTPLFFYLLREADIIGKGEKLGPVASAILLEVFGTMLLQCDSFLKKDWQPDPCLMSDKHGEKTFTLADIVRYIS